MSDKPELPAKRPQKETVQFTPAAVLQMRQVAEVEGITVAALVERALSLYYLEREVKRRGGKLLVEEPGGGLKEIGDHKP